MGTIKYGIAAGIIAGLGLAGFHQAIADEKLSHAYFNEEGQLMRPENATWPFVSTSVSIASANMGGQMDQEQAPQMAETAGRFDVIQMSPEAFIAYKETGEFPEGTVFTMSFYGLNNHNFGALDRFWGDGLTGMEVSVKDSERFESGWGYFRFENGSDVATAFPVERCAQCHMDRGAHDMVFTQLYTAFQPTE